MTNPFRSCSNCVIKDFFSNLSDEDLHNYKKSIENESSKVIYKLVYEIICQELERRASNTDLQLRKNNK